MKFNDMVHYRQYKVQLSSGTPKLDLDSLKEFGIWHNIDDEQYFLMIQSKNDPNKDPVIFEHNFIEKTGLQPNQFKMEAKYGPLTLQSAVDSPWF